MASFAGQHKDYKGGYSNRPSGTSSAGSGYTPGGDSYKNYSQNDQQKMFDQAGGKKNFQNQVANIEQKYKRSADTQRYLNQTNQYNRFQNRGQGIARDAQGRQILSMQSPYMTAQAPTFGQFMGDMGRGVGSIMQGFAEKGTPLMNMAKGIYGGIQDFFAPMNPMPAINTGIENLQSGFDDFMQSGRSFNMMLGALPPEQRRIYDQAILVPGTTREDAFRQAQGLSQMAMGGIANLN